MTVPPGSAEGPARWRRAAAPLLAGAALALAGCASGTAEDVSGTLARYNDALRSDAFDEACALLSARARSELEASAGAPCADAAGGELAPQPGRWTVRVFGDQAVARTGRRATFLARFPDGWRVVAAGCERVGPQRRFDCRVQGG